MTFQELFERIKSWSLGVFAKGADLDGKQNTISDLSDIRSGASLGATAYQKPSGGIPATDLADGVIPDVPTVPVISTDISADASSDTKTASPKAVKDYVDGHSSPDAVKYVSQELTSSQQAQARTNIGAVSTADLADTNEAIRNGLSDLSSDISDLDDAIQAVDRGEYVTAWDGASAPVVADIPAGVQVEYSSQTYTGELAASASTLNKIYLVGTGTTDEYDRYITSRAGTEGSYTYSWVPLGSTEITLSDYATNAKLSQLEAEVGDLDELETTDKSSIVAAINEAAQTGGGANLSGYVVVATIQDLPDPGEATLGYLVDSNLYLYVGTGGDTLDGKYQDCGPFRGPAGVGFESVSTTQDGTLVITLTNGDTITIDLNHNHLAYYSKVAETSNPSGGFLPDVVYSLGTLTGTVTFALAAAVTGNVNHYFWMFDTGSTAPTITWPVGITWADGSAPTVAASKHYEISVLNGIAYYSEV